MGFRPIVFFISDGRLIWYNQCEWRIAFILNSPFTIHINQELII